MSDLTLIIICFDTDFIWNCRLFIKLIIDQKSQLASECNKPTNKYGSREVEVIEAKEESLQID